MWNKTNTRVIFWGENEEYLVQFIPLEEREKDNVCKFNVKKHSNAHAFYYIARVALSRGPHI